MNRRVNPESPTRRERAQATRRRILSAAHELFCDRGYTGTRMTDVAAAAGIAVQTVYFTFHTKAELLQACYERGVLGEDDPLPPPLQPWWAEMMAASSPPEAIRQFAAGTGSILARVAVLDDVVRSAAHEPDARAVRARTEQLRRDGYRDVVRHIAERFGLRDGVNVDTATDVALTLAGPAVYRTLVVEYRWPPEKYVDWMAHTLAQALLPAAPVERG